MLIDNCTGDIPNGKIAEYHASIGNLVAAYEQTVFTEEEAVLFDSLKRELQALAVLETGLAAQSGARLEEIDRLFAAATQHLRGLSDIQIEVGRSLNDHSKQLVASNSLLTYLELA
ncbi:hypothetical protein RZS08_41315, partial [Arthrospira platensis SPKY1]|nr:hypothetical protein [Arthrospira platensis SPKY1]